MLLRIYDVREPSGNPSSMLGSLAGSPGVLTGTSASPFLLGPTIEPVVRTVNDVGTGSPLTPAVVGKLIGMRFSAGDNGSNYIVNSTAQQQYLDQAYGVVLAPPAQIPGPNGTLLANPGGESTIMVNGYCMAYATTGGTTAIALGSFLTADGAGNLTIIASQTFGTILAQSLGTLAVSQTATLIPVRIGGGF